MATERRQQIIDWLRDSGNPRAEELLHSLAQMNTDDWEQKHRRDLRKIMGYADIEKNTLPLRDRAKGEFDTYVDNPEWYIKDKAAKLGVNVNDLKKTLDELQKEKEYFEGRERRKKEVKEGIKWNFASDWAKQRYIDTPEKSYWANPELSVEHIPDIADAAAGFAAGISDVFLPKGIGTFVGPTIRGVRSLAQGEKLGDVGTNFAADASLNAGVDFLPTLVLNKIGRVSKKAASEVANYAQQSANLKTAEESVKDMKKILGMVDNAKLSSKGLDEAELATLRKNIASLPEGPVKNDLMKILNENPDKLIGKNLNSDKLAEIGGIGDATTNVNGIKKYIETADSKLNQAKTVPDKKYPVFNENGTLKSGETELENAIIAKKALGKGMSKVNKGAAKAVELATGPAGSGIVKTIDTANDKRHVAKGETNRAEIDWYKQNYLRDWQAGFVPNGNPNDPKVKAYNELVAEGKIIQTPTISNIFGGQ